MIGVGGAVYLLINGRIMGASGILGGLIDGSGKATAAERLWFVAGVFGVPTVIYLMTGPIDTHATTNITVLIARAFWSASERGWPMAALRVTVSVASLGLTCAALLLPFSTFLLVG